MEIGTSMSVVQTLLTVLQCSQLIDFCSKRRISAQLDHLQATVKRIQAVLEDAEAKQVLSNHEQVYIHELKDALYEADDLFDEFLTLAQLKKLNEGMKDRLLSLFTKIKVDYRISQKVDKIQLKLDGIASRNQLISFKHDPEPIKKRSRETCSYVRVVDIVGRDDDLEKIVGMLLNSDPKHPVSFLSIVGIGGLGKTALAQLVFNDPRVTGAFSLKLWICVSDQDQNDFDEKEMLRKILEAATDQKHHDATKDRLQRQLRQLLEGRKYLLVLDDVWTENREQWRRLVDFLIGGQRGSWIVVTTRSRRTAGIVGDGLMHDLKGLSKENSWCLFQRVAFGSELSNPPEDLINIGKKIVERCANVPLAIRVAGSLLYGQDKSKWLSFQELPLAQFEENKSGIMPILKLSYHHLESPLKSCFGYCALFPKDYVMRKKTLMRLWVAQGYIPSFDERSMEDVAEEYFLVLLRRCFFQDIEEDEYGEIESCKIHDLMHDVAQEVVGREICRVAAINDVDKRVRHISTIRECESYTFNKTCIRSYLQVHPYRYEEGKMDQVSVEALVCNWKYLRVLDLSKLGIKSLQSSIGELIHLRYLDLSCNRNLEMLPKQITKLYNLKALDLGNCWSLKELPKDINKLVNLKALDIRNCDGLSNMPRSIRNLSHLEELTMFVVGEANCDPERCSNGLEDLKVLNNLKGYLTIKIGFSKKKGNVVSYGRRMGGCLSNKSHLNWVLLKFSNEKCKGRVEYDEEIIEDLQPHSNLKGLSMSYYAGVRMPKWTSEETKFANLVGMSLYFCVNLKCLGYLSTLKHLKFLKLQHLSNMLWLVEKKKTIEVDSNSERGTSSSISKVQEFSLFPSLEKLDLWGMPKLKGWWRGVGLKDDDQILALPRLKQLKLQHCQNLTAIVRCLALENLNLININKKLGIKIETKDNWDENQRLGVGIVPKLWFIKVENLAWLDSQNIDKEAFKCLQFLEIRHDNEMESLGECGEMFRNISSSLRSLTIEFCFKLRSVSGGLEHLSALEMLVIHECPNLKLTEEDESSMAWQSLNHSLLTLKLQSLRQLVNLPGWIQNLTALQTLEISDCQQLKSLPNWMPKLTSLRELQFRMCPARLQERCQQSTGEDWPHIQHISSITFKDI